jgi:histone H3/H4
MKISKAAIRKIVKSLTLTGLTPRIGNEAVEQVQVEVDTLLEMDYDPENYARDILEKAAILAAWAGRKTIKPIDIINFRTITDERLQERKTIKAQRDERAKKLFGVI